MSHREVDFNVVMDACYHWLKEYHKECIEYSRELESRSTWSLGRMPKDKIMERKEMEEIRVKRLLTLSKAPGSLNRIIHLSAEDAYMLFGDL